METFGPEDLNLFRQWFDSVHDNTPEYLGKADYALAKRLYERLGMRVPDSILAEVPHSEPR